MFFRLLLIVGLLFVNVVHAKDVKVGVVDLEKAIGGTEYAKKFLEAVDKDLKPLTDRIDSLKKKGKQKLDNYTKNIKTLSDSEKAKYEKELQEIETDFKYEVSKYQREKNLTLQKLLGEMTPKIEKVVDELVKDGKYDLIIGKQVLLHFNSSFDVTPIITQKLNKLNEK